MIKVVALEPVFRYDVENEVVLDISEKQFQNDPKKVYEIPATQFWTGLVVAKILRYADNDELQSITESIANLPVTGKVNPKRNKKDELE